MGNCAYTASTMPASIYNNSDTHSAFISINMLLISAKLDPIMPSFFMADTFCKSAGIYFSLHV